MCIQCINYSGSHAQMPNPLSPTHNLLFESEQSLKPHPQTGDKLDPTVVMTSAHISPSTRIVELEQQLSAVLDSKQQLQNELNSALDQQHQSQHEMDQIRKNQEHAVEFAKGEVKNSYESQIANLQYSLMQSESALQQLERKVAEVSSSHSIEVEKVVRSQEEIRALQLAEKDQKHAEHVARLTEKFTSQMESNEGPKDVDELEAERLKMIKSKMREMFEAEKKQILTEHQQQKARIQQTTQKQLEDYRTQTEQLANTKLQEVHAQFMTAHQALLEQKNQADALVKELNLKLNQVQHEHSSILQERADLQSRYDTLSESHLVELEKAKHDSNSLENRLNDWKQKASKLETKLHTSESELQSDLDSLRKQNKIALSKLKEEYDHKLKSVQQLADEYHRKFLQADTEKCVSIDSLTKNHQERLQKLTQEHNLEVDTMNQSLRESNAERGSLEAAEEHMQSLQKQLENYRKQEMSFQNQLDEKERQHKDGIEAYRQQFEKEKKLEVEHVAARFNSNIKSLEEEIASLTASVDSGDTERRHHEKMESLKVRHKKRVSELEAVHEKSQRSLSSRLEASHAKEVETLNQNHDLEMCELRKECIKKSEAEKEQLLGDLETSKQAEIQTLIDEHKTSIENATKCVSVDISTKLSEQIELLKKELTASKQTCSDLEEMRKDLLSQLELAQRQIHDTNQTLQRTHTEMERLSQDCDRYQNRSKSLEVDLSISQSAHEQDKLQLSVLQQEIDGLRAQTNSLESELHEAKQSQAAGAENEEMLTQLTNNLASKNVTIGDLQLQNDSLNTEVFSLTKKYQQLVEKTHSVQEQLETSWGANEEIESLQQQIAELVPFKDEAASLKEKIEILESTYKSKDEALMSLESQLEQATQYVTDVNTRATEKNQAIAESAQEIDLLREKLTMKEGQEKELQEMIEEFESKLETLSSQVGDKDEVIAVRTTTMQSLQSQLSSATDRLQELQEQNETLKEDNLRSQEILSTVSEDDYKERYEQLREDFEKVNREKEQLSAELSTAGRKEDATATQNSTLQEMVVQLNQKVQELKSSLVDKEAEFSRSRSEFSQQLKEAELREKSLQNKQKYSSSKESGTRDKGSLEDTLTKARQALTDKLAERSSLEKELSLHCTELERRLAEQQHLEDLLVEKSRFEQELQNQKEQLQNELEVIECKMKSGFGEDRSAKAKGGATDRKPKMPKKQGPKTRHKK